MHNVVTDDPSGLIDGHELSQTSPRQSAETLSENQNASTASNVRSTPPGPGIGLIYGCLPSTLYCLGKAHKTLELDIHLRFIWQARSVIEKFPMMKPVKWEEVEANHRNPEMRYMCILYVEEIEYLEEAVMVMREPKLVYTLEEDKILFQMAYILRPDTFGTVANPLGTALMNPQDMKPVQSKILMGYYRAPKAELLNIVQPRAIEPGIIVSTMDHLPD